MLAFCNITTGSFILARTKIIEKKMKLQAPHTTDEYGINVYT